METENGTVQTMEAVLSGEEEVLSDEQPTASENETPIEAKEEETTEATEKPAEETPKEEKTKEKTYTQTEYKAAVDKAVTKYMQVHKKDNELINSLKSEKKEALKKLREATDSSEYKALLNADIEDGMEEDRAKNLDNLRKKFKNEYNDFLEKREEVEDSAEVISLIAENMNKDYVKAWGLNDENPYARAQNGFNLINEAIGLHESNTIYKDVLEVLVANGTDLRERVDNLVTELHGMSKDARKLRIEKLVDELEITPTSAPPKKETPATETNEELIRQRYRENPNDPKAYKDYQEMLDRKRGIK